jgi:ABC-type transport system involved in multi-copper enzyme maturation permease subunit
MQLWTIVRLTLREASRRRLLLTVGLLTLIMICFTAWGFSRLPTLQCRGAPCPPAEVRLITALMLILVAYMFNVVVAMGAVFVAAPTIAGEIESGIALAMLPRPIRRIEIVLGKWLGLAVLVAAYTALTAGLEFLAVDAILGYMPPHPILAILYLSGEAVVLLTFAILLSTRLAPTTSGVIAVVLFGMAWLAGVAESIGLAFANTTLTDVGILMSLLLPTDALWRGVIYNLEPVALITIAGASREATANPFFVAAPPPLAYVVWAVAWAIVVLGAAVYSFQQRDL